MNANLRNEYSKSDCLKLKHELSLMREELEGAKWKLRQSKTLVDLILEKMGGIVYDYNVEKNIGYFFYVDANGDLIKKAVPSFRIWVKENVQAGKELLKQFDRYLEDNIAWQMDQYRPIESKIKFFSKEFHWYRIMYQALFDGEGNIVSFIGYMQDIDKEKTKLGERSSKNALI